MQPNKSKEYIFKSSQNINFQINPEEYGFDLHTSKAPIDLTTFQGVSEIYHEAMAPTSVSIGTMPDTNEKVVIKKTFKEYLVTNFQKTQAAQEFPLHCSLKHENIVKALEWDEDEKAYILIMEYMNKADYFEEKIDLNLQPVKHEEKMKSYMVDALEGLEYLHNKGIVHGDIKLENLLVQKDEENEEPPIVKIADFGLSRLLSKETGNFYMEYAVGSMSYMAPEIKAKSHVNEKIDMWALGVALYKMAVAYKPTQIAGYKYGSGPLPFRKVDWKKRSQELQDLIVQMMEVNAEKRISASEALQHPWFQM